jgi:hypothetical protein
MPTGDARRRGARPAQRGRGLILLYRHFATALWNVGAQISGMTQIGATAIKTVRTNSRLVLNGLILGSSVAFWKKLLSITTQACIFWNGFLGSVSAMAPTANWKGKQ